MKQGNQVVQVTVYLVWTSIIKPKYCFSIIPDSEYPLSEIIGGCKLGNSSWQRILYERYYRFAFSICVRYTYGFEEAREILNDGFVKVFRHITQFVEPNEEEALSKLFMGWLKKIMIHTGINHSVAERPTKRWYVIDEQAAADGAYLSPANHLAY